MVSRCVMLALVASSLLIVACGGGNDEVDSTQVPAANIAAMETPTVAITQAPTATPEPATATAPPASPTALVEDDIALSIEPSSGSYGTSFDYTFTGLTPRAEYVLVTKLPDGTEDRLRHVADSSGTYLIAGEAGPTHMAGEQLRGWLSEPGEPAGEYVVELLSADGETVLATDTFTVTPAETGTATPTATAGGPSIRVSGEGGPASGTFLFITTGLTADHPYTQVVRYPDGREDSVEAVYDESTMELVGASGPYKGEPLSGWVVEPGDPLGEYTVEIRDSASGDILASATFIVE
ncbi:MAG: hypothetical protein M3440_01555 [Chloroflexota bacterium]|nr:hypothetical protein [Chloroflexota bacterium]